MKMNTLILDSDDFSSEALVQQLKQILRSNLAKPTRAPDKITFIKAIKKYPWDIVVINFSSYYFCNLTGKKIETFISDVKKRQPKMLHFIGTAGTLYQAKLLQKFGVHVVSKKYDEDKVNQIFGITNLRILPGVVTLDSIREIVCDYYDIPYDKVAQKTKKREVVQVRQTIMFFAKLFTKHSLKFISEQFGGNEHTRVIHSCQVVKDRIDTEPIFKEQVEELKKKIAA